MAHLPICRGAAVYPVQIMWTIDSCLVKPRRGRVVMVLQASWWATARHHRLARGLKTPRGRAGRPGPTTTRAILPLTPSSTSSTKCLASAQPNQADSRCIRLALDGGRRVQVRNPCHTMEDVPVTLRSRRFPPACAGVVMVIA